MKIARTALVVPVVLLAAACGANDADTLSTKSAPNASFASDSGSGVEAAAPAPPGTVADLNLTSTTGAARNGAKTAGADPLTKAVISKGQISLHTSNLDRARFELQKVLDTVDGTIANEKSEADGRGRTTRAHLELRVPSDKFDAAMDAISKLGILVDRNRTSQDVTTQVIDTDARVRSQKLSLARIQALLAQAKSLNQVIAIESELSQRQADLDSLEQQQKYLADQTSQATINVYLSKPGRHPGSATKKANDDGFGAGLSAGWKNLGTATAAVLKTVGAVLPFAVVLGLIGVPLWWARRRRSA